MGITLDKILFSEATSRGELTNPFSYWQNGRRKDVGAQTNLQPEYPNPDAATELFLLGLLTLVSILIVFLVVAGIILCLRKGRKWIFPENLQEDGYTQNGESFSNMAFL